MALTSGWRETPKQVPSRAEIKLILALERQEILKGGFGQLEICLWSTRPSVFYPTKGIVVYLEESKAGDRKRQKIIEELEKKGLKVLRFSYTDPISDQRLAEVVQKVKEELEK
jgi:hypothetical protein